MRGLRVFSDSCSSSGWPGGPAARDRNRDVNFIDAEEHLNISSMHVSEIAHWGGRGKYGRHSCG